MARPYLAALKALICKKWVFLSVYFKHPLKMVNIWISFWYSKNKLPKSSNGRRWGRWRYTFDIFVTSYMSVNIDIFVKIYIFCQIWYFCQFFTILIVDIFINCFWYFYQRLIFMSIIDIFINYLIKISTDCSSKL